MTRFCIVFLVVAGLATAQTPARPEFEVASIKLNTSGSGMTSISPPIGGRFTARNASLKILIGLAYNVQNFAISGGPGWIESARYDITAKASEGNITIDQMRPMLQSLLEDRFQLKVHREQKDMPVYALLAGKNGVKLPAAKEGGCFEFKPGSTPPPPSPSGPPPCGGMMMGPNVLQGGRISMTQFVNTLARIMGRPVIDKTGYTGTFDVHLEFTPEGTAFGGRGFIPKGPPDAPPIDSSAPSIFTAIQEQLGLKLESEKAPQEILVVDGAEKASEN